VGGWLMGGWVDVIWQEPPYLMEWCWVVRCASLWHSSRQSRLTKLEYSPPPAPPLPPRLCPPSPAPSPSPPPLAPPHALQEYLYLEFPSETTTRSGYNIKRKNFVVAGLKRDTLFVLSARCVGVGIGVGGTHCLCCLPGAWGWLGVCVCGLGGGVG
jgi:hypothetical protein